MRRGVDLAATDVSERFVASIFRMETIFEIATALLVICN
jgi:hypothetical protein